ncbi:MAG: S-methyl-5'-thioadenosine phosphorylase [Candidatus Heimdallarchaeota archaeon]|nr:S-methyl-5'-thioadenosine phosphorylase [Candidatus Heimdallarchaeota archaeon]
MSKKIAVIGGSGVYDLFEDGETVSIKTPYGKVENISKITNKETEAYFLPRHGPSHSVPPHLINYRANIYALHTLEVEDIYATNAVGSINQKIHPGEFVVPDQLIDMTKNRILTFFDGDTEIVFEDGTSKQGVVHLDYTEPYTSRLRKRFLSLANESSKKFHDKGVLVCTEGPRFETPAEIKMFQSFGGTLVGMTSVPEAILAKEVQIAYATLCLVTNYGAGMQEEVTHAEVIELFNKKIQVVKSIMQKIIEGN